MKNLKLSRKMYEKYCETVKDNEGISKKQAELKMTRNAILAFSSERHNKSTHYKYGGLHFIVANGNIVWMRNYCTPQEGWKRNNWLYIKLNKVLGIEDDTTLFQLYKKDLTYKYKQYKRNKAKKVMKSKREALTS